MSQNLLARIVDKSLTNQDRHCLTALSNLYFGALTSACRLLSVVSFFLFKICQARGPRLRLRVQSQLHLPFRLARCRDSLQIYFPKRVIHHLWRLMLCFKDHMRMVLYQTFLVIQLQQVFQPGVLKEHLSPSSSLLAWE